MFVVCFLVCSWFCMGGIGVEGNYCGDVFCVVVVVVEFVLSLGGVGVMGLVGYEW